MTKVSPARTAATLTIVAKNHELSPFVLTKSKRAIFYWSPESFVIESNGIFMSLGLSGNFANVGRLNFYTMSIYKASL